MQRESNGEDRTVGKRWRMDNTRNEDLEGIVEE